MGGKMNWDRTRLEQTIRKHGVELNDPPGNYRDWGKEGKERTRSSSHSSKDKPVVVVVNRKRKKSPYMAEPPRPSPPDRETLAANIRKLISIYESDIEERKAQIENLRGHIKRLMG